MRKRRGGVRAGMQKVLCERLESLKNLNSTTIHEIIEHLLSNYPEYKRQNRHTFINLVQDSLHPLLSRQKRQTQSLLSPPRKKHKINFDDQDTSSEESNSCSDDDNGVLSEDSKKVEQQFDLTKSILRASYIESSSKKEKENNLEFDFAVRDSDEVDFVKLGKEDEGGPGFKDLGGKKKVEEEGGPRFKDFGGMKKVLEQLETKVLVSLYQHHLLQWVGVRPISGLLLHGPPGCGKTKLAHAIANETGFPFYKISATELVSGVSGESEENIRGLFQKAYKTAPSIIFIDEIDAIASKRENLQREMERRIVTQLMACMDANSRSFKSSDEQGYVLVIGATNRPNVIDPALRRPGRFDYEIELGVPDENARLEILLVLTRTKRLEGCFDLPKIAMSTPGFVAADLEALVNGAAYLAVKKILDERKSKLFRNSIDEEQSMEWLKEPVPLEIMENIRITMTDFEEAIKMVQPSTTREGFSAIPKVKWEDVGGLDLLRKELDRHIVRRIKYPAKYERFGVDLEMGFLLYGPPGCGKTMIAKAVANDAGANFIHIKGPELLNKYVGESELAVRTLFSRARTCSPCILFFDEVDALTTKHGKEGGWVIERLLNQLLIELDGVDQRRGVFIIGATNRPEVMDNAVLRPGRFGNLLYVPLPTPDQRGLILKALARNKPLDASVDLNAIGRMEACDNFSGADLAALMNEAALAAVDDDLTETIKTTHFEQALTKISPSVTPEQRRHYQVLSERFKSSNISA